MAANHYCTYFDHRYAGQGLTMLRSVRAHGGDEPLWVLCLSEAAEAVVAAFGLPGVRIVPLAALERYFPSLAAARQDRSRIEYYFTLTPHIVRYVFDHAPEAERVAYLDGDLFFFAPIERVWAEAGGAPVAIVPHNFQRGARHLAKYGEYNVGWVGFARAEQGLRCLDFWTASCREWCRDKPDGLRFADQGYLARFHEFAPDLAVIRHKGCNLGPWNVGRYDVRLAEGQILIDEDPLLFFHFHGFRKGLGGRWFNTHLIHRTGTPRIVRDHIYRPYLAALLWARARIAALAPAAAWTGAPGNELTRNKGNRSPLKTRAYNALRQGLRVLDLVTGNALKEPAESRPDAAPGVRTQYRRH